MLGTGFMGAGIAAIAAMQGVPVRFKDMKHEQVGRGLAAVRAVLQERLTKKQITRQQFDDQLSLVSGTIEYTGFGNVPLVIEAVFEDLAVKHQVLAEIEKVLPPSAIFASNTSTIPIAQIADGAPRPERVIGMHFFSPVQKMPLLEVIVTPRTAPEVIATTVAFGRKLGKTVIVVNDAPGFYVNRILAPYINEAGRMLDEGVAIEAIDRAHARLRISGRPDHAARRSRPRHRGKVRRDHVEGVRRPAASRRHRSARCSRPAASDGNRRRDSISTTRTEKRAGSTNPCTRCSRPARTARSFRADDIQPRCSLAMVNEAARCLEEHIIRVSRATATSAPCSELASRRSAADRSATSTSIGAAEIVRQLEALNVQHPGRFAPCALLVSMARDGKRFYPATGKPV